MALLCQEVAPISNRLFSADSNDGHKLFRNLCSRCHTVEAGGRNDGAPNLWGIVGRKKASTNFDNYSTALRTWQGVWTQDDLNLFLSAPMAAVPGTFMDFAGISDEAERMDLIGYLDTLRDN